jgi:hypothetical protein
MQPFIERVGSDRSNEAAGPRLTRMVASGMKVMALAVAAAAFATPASAIIVGGIDFGSTAGNHLETGTIAQSFTNAAGEVATAYGMVGTVNGDTTYCADGSANCTLYFVSTSLVTASPASDKLYFGNTRTTLYYSGAPPINLLGQSSTANLTFIAALSPWASLRGENGIDPTAFGLTSDSLSFQALIGASVGLLGGGVLSVDRADGIGLAAVESALDASTIPTFTGAFADLQFGSSANNLVINPFDAASALADSCFTGAPQVGDFCMQGSSDFRGVLTPVPELSTAWLVPLGLVMIGTIASRRARAGAGARSRNS